MGGFWEGLESVFGGELILNLNVELISNRNACESANVRELARVPVQNQFHDADDGDDGDVRARTSTHGRRTSTYIDVCRRTIKTALSVPLLLRFCLMLAQFFALVTHFFDILTHLKLSCNFLTFFNDFSSSFGGFGVVWGWILGGFFEDF